MKYTVIAILFTVSLAACLDAPREGQMDDSDGDANDSGTTKEELPSPGPFAESKSDLLILHTFLVKNGTDILAKCGYDDSTGEIRRAADDGAYLHGLESIIRGCARPLEDRDREYAEEAIQEGTEHETFEEFYHAAQQVVDRVALKLNADSGPSTVVEAEVLYQLMDRHHFGLQMMDTAIRYWEPYQQGTDRDTLQLQNAYLNLLGARGEADAIEQILDKYPWGNDACEFPEASALERRVHEKLATALELAKPDTLWRNRLVNFLKPEIDYYRNQSWTIGLLPMEVLLETHLAYWENVTQEDSWPTREEAEYLLAERRNTSRTLWTETVLWQFVMYFEDPDSEYFYPWANTESGAAAFMGKMAVRPAFDVLECNT